MGPLSLLVPKSTKQTMTFNVFNRELL